MTLSFLRISRLDERSGIGCDLQPVQARGRCSATGWNARHPSSVLSAELFSAGAANIACTSVRNDNYQRAQTSAKLLS